MKESEVPAVQLVAYVDDTLPIGKAEDVATAITAIQTEAANGGLKLLKAKTQVWSPNPPSIHLVQESLQRRTLQGRVEDTCGILLSGEAVSEELEDTIPIGDEAFVTDRNAHGNNRQTGASFSQTQRG